MRRAELTEIVDTDRIPRRRARYRVGVGEVDPGEPVGPPVAVLLDHDEALAWLRAHPDDPAAARSLRCLMEKARANHAFRMRIDRDDATGEITNVRVD